MGIPVQPLQATGRLCLLGNEGWLLDGLTCLLMEGRILPLGVWDHQGPLPATPEHLLQWIVDDPLHLQLCPVVRGYMELQQDEPQVADLAMFITWTREYCHQYQRDPVRVEMYWGHLSLCSVGFFGLADWGYVRTPPEGFWIRFHLLSWASSQISL